VSNALAKKLDDLTSRTGIKVREIAQLLGTRPETVSRWRSGQVEPQRDRLHRLLMLDYLFYQLLELYRPDEARLWLFSPNPLLEGRSPAQKIEGDEADSVLDVIDQLKDGAYI